MWSDNGWRATVWYGSGGYNPKETRTDTSKSTYHDKDGNRTSGINDGKNSNSQ
jgi:hypothetical protein